MAGIEGTVVVSTFSSNIAGTFALPRAIPATAVLIAEPLLPIIPRQSHPPTSHHSTSCPRPIINVGAKLDTANNFFNTILNNTKIAPIVNKIMKITKPFSTLTEKMSHIKSRILQKPVKAVGIFARYCPFTPPRPYKKLHVFEDKTCSGPKCVLARRAPDPNAFFC